MTLVLASASPRRAELLASAGFNFEIQPTIVDETPDPGEQAEAYVLRIARAKAVVAQGSCRKSGITVLAADTVVVADGELLGKPVDENDAIRMLKLLSGAVHDVFTGVVVRTDERETSEVVRTRVHLLPLTDGEIRWYVDTGEPIDKAGAYGIQGRAARFIDWIEGSWSNVVGLPVHSVHRLLKEVNGKN